MTPQEEQEEECPFVNSQEAFEIELHGKKLALSSSKYDVWELANMAASLLQIDFKLDKKDLPPYAG